MNFVGWVLGDTDNELLLGGRDDGVAERVGDFEGRTLGTTEGLKE